MNKFHLSCISPKAFFFACDFYDKNKSVQAANELDSFEKGWMFEEFFIFLI